MSEGSELAAQVEQAAWMLGDVLRQSADQVPRLDDGSDTGSAAGPPGGLAAVRLAVALRQVADQTLAACVRQAREAGHTWQELGDTLNTTRQAAYQRFGRPAAGAVDPRGGSVVSEELLPGAAERALGVFDAYFQGLDEQLFADFVPEMRVHVPVQKLVEGRARLADTIGRFEGTGEPFVRRIGKYTAVDVPLAFEAGERTGQVSFDREGMIAGLFVRLPEAV
jgi:hypothetical protein